MCQFVRQLTLNLFANLVARPDIHGTVKLELDECLVPELGVRDDVGPSASHPSHSRAHRVHGTSQDALACGGGAAWVAESPLKVLAISADDVGIPVPKGGG